MNTLSEDYVGRQLYLVLKSAVFWLKKWALFRFLASVKLAVPLILVIAGVVAWGTLVESKYNPEMARLVVYNSIWFTALMTLLWVNIFCATISRYPFRWHHLGFLVTHLGLLMLLAGGVITTNYGIDGTLAITEGQSGNTVGLSQLVFSVAAEDSGSLNSVEVQRGLSPSKKFVVQNQKLESIVEIQEYLPFAQISSTYTSAGQSDDIAIGFLLKSDFFNVAEFLHSRLSPSKEMGPARFELKVGKPVSTLNQGIAQARSRQVIKALAKQGVLRILESKTGHIIKEISLETLRSNPRFKIQDLEINLHRAFQNAIVSSRGLSEGHSAQTNPALEFLVKIGTQSYREVAYARFPEFTLSPEPEPAYRFEYSVESVEPDRGGEGGLSPTGEAEHLVRFYVDSHHSDQVFLELIKGGDAVLRKAIRPGETVHTPWMGMQVTLASVIPNAVALERVTPVEPQPRENLPGGALMIRPKKGGDSIWIPEGESRRVIIDGRFYSFYFGHKLFFLPFNIFLQKFSKVDYPGTETPMSFESVVSINDQPETHMISMNEPLLRDGFTIYLSSYQLNANGPSVAIFSVNRDPGRRLKYLGSLILCLGIVTFVIMRSGPFKRRMRKAI